MRPKRAPSLNVVGTYLDLQWGNISNDYWRIEHEETSVKGIIWSQRLQWCLQIISDNVDKIKFYVHHTNVNKRNEAMNGSGVDDMECTHNLFHSGG